MGSVKYPVGIPWGERDLATARSDRHRARSRL